MGNRAAVVFTKGDDISVSAYLQWNGGPESIYSFLHELRRRKCGGRVDYAAARFIHVVADFFDIDETTSMSLGVMSPPAGINTDDLAELAGMADDHGVYVVDLSREEWVVRRFLCGHDKPTMELTTTQVNAERRAACKHPYMTGKKNESGGGGSIREQFLKMRPKVSEHG